jgi:serine/threonine protein kinase
MASSSSSSSWQAAVRDNPLLEAKLNEFLDTGKMMGEGSVGTVKHVICRGVGAAKKHAGQGFALKVIEKSTIEKHKLQNHLHEEVRLHMRLRHQNIVRLHTHMEDSKRIYILLDLCDKTLFQHLRDHPSGMPVDSNEPASFLLDTAHGLQYLHQQDILHRDIKPENLLLHKNKGSQKYRILIADFGWSKESHIGEERKTFCGTLDYLAPEMVDNFNQGFGVDIWALGILLYEMLTGRAPWDGKTQGACVQQIKNCEASVSFPDQVPTSARQLIRSILRRQPEQRAPIEQIINHEYIVKRTDEVSRPGTEVHVMPRPSPIDHLTIDTSSPVA